MKKIFLVVLAILVTAVLALFAPSVAVGVVIFMIFYKIIMS